MNELVINMTYSGTAVSITLEEKLNVLQGDSGKGKTLAMQAIEMYCRNNDIKYAHCDHNDAGIDKKMLLDRCSGADVVLLDDADLYLSADTFSEICSSAGMVVLYMKDPWSIVPWDPIIECGVEYDDGKLEVSKTVINVNHLVKKLNVYHCTFGETLRGYLGGKTDQETVDFYKKVNLCTCGGTPQVIESECMGDYDLAIVCRECGRAVRRSMYDYDCTDKINYDELCVRDWNAGLTDSDVKAKLKLHEAKIRIREEDLKWAPYYPNNMPQNGIAGEYALMFQIEHEKIYAYKWTIMFQLECDPISNTVSEDAAIEAYILYYKIYPDVKGSLKYPEPDSEFKCWESEDNVFENSINDEGSFVRAYRTLEAAKADAAYRCSFWGMNRTTIINKDRNPVYPNLYGKQKEDI